MRILNNCQFQDSTSLRFICLAPQHYAARFRYGPSHIEELRGTSNRVVLVLGNRFTCNARAGRRNGKDRCTGSWRKLSRHLLPRLGFRIPVRCPECEDVLLGDRLNGRQVQNKGNYSLLSLGLVAADYLHMFCPSVIGHLLVPGSTCPFT